MRDCRTYRAHSPWTYLPLGAQLPTGAFLRADPLEQAEPRLEPGAGMCVACGLGGIFARCVFVLAAPEKAKAHFSGFAATLRDRFLVPMVIG